MQGKLIINNFEKMNKELNQMSSQELEELQIKISKELNNRQLSTKAEELEKIKQKFIGKYIKYVNRKSIYVGYVKNITAVDGGYGLTYAGFILDTYDDISLSINSCYYIFCNTKNFDKIQFITKDKMKEIFKKYIVNLEDSFKYLLYKGNS